MPTASLDERDLVLYVEDHPMNVLLMQTVFEFRPELELLVAEDGASARACVAPRRPILLLLDLRLPDCHGADLLDELRHRPGWATIPAIAVTADTGFTPAGTGFGDVWQKPLRVPTLLARLDRVLVPRPTPGSPPSVPALMPRDRHARPRTALNR